STFPDLIGIMGPSGQLAAGTNSFTPPERWKTSVGQPDEAGEAARARGAAVRIEARIADCAEAAAIHGVDAASGEANARQLVDVGHGLPLVDAGPEGLLGFGMTGNEGFAHLGPDLEGCRADGRAEPDQHLVGRQGK